MTKNAGSREPFDSAVADDLALRKAVLRGRAQGLSDALDLLSAITERPMRPRGLSEATGHEEQLEALLEYSTLFAATLRELGARLRSVLDELRGEVELHQQESEQRTKLTEQFKLR